MGVEGRQVMLDRAASQDGNVRERSTRGFQKTLGWERRLSTGAKFLVPWTQAGI